MFQLHTDTFDVVVPAAGTATKDVETKGVRGTVEVMSSSAGSVVTLQGPLGGAIAAATLVAAGDAATLTFIAPPGRVVLQMTAGVAAGTFTAIVTQSEG